MKCVSCGSANKEGLAFCEECGKPLQSQDTGPVKAKSFQKCPQCMTELDEGVKICHNCGYKLETQPSIENTNPRKQKKARHARKEKEPTHKGFIRSNPYRALLLLLLVAGIGLGAYIAWDVTRHAVYFYQTDSMAKGVIEAFFPYLSDVQPRKEEFKKNGQDVVSFNYLTQLDVTLPDGKTAKTTAGVIIYINRNTGGIDLIQLP